MSRTLAIALCGSGGAGVVACGELLLRGWARAGGLGFLRKAFGPQIRGGESAALLCLGEDETYLPTAAMDLLVALDWNQFARFEDEIVLGPQSIVLCPDDEEPPAGVQASGATVLALPLASAVAGAHPEGRRNMFALGLLGQLLGLDAEALAALASARLAGKAQAYRDAAAACIDAGAGWPLAVTVDAPSRPGGERWLLTGNQAAGYGALEAGVRFVAAYPITPASDVLEYLAGALETLGGQLVQAEDELAAVNMVLGAAFGGVDAFTATSGPGLALMTESLGLAVASETPLTVLNVMRGGPSTGIPTKSEQGDLDIALHGLHGDAPHLVLAALDIADCAFTTSWAVALARQLQTPALVLSDQFLGQSLAVVSPPDLPAAPPGATAEGAEAAEEAGEYLRYRLTASGVSALALPGDPGLRFTADGLEHNERGAPSTVARDHAAQLDKRARKLTSLDPGPYWGTVDGEGELALVAFGSASAAARAAAAQLRAGGTACRVICLRLLAPLPAAALGDALAGCRRVLVVEQNHSAQCWRHLRANLGDVPVPAESYARPGPAPLDPAAIAAILAEEPVHG
ncbi:MAG: 2-oxoacid:acceptor oxidoreductase subunit alpha [Pseudohaliea sp.]